MSDEVKKDFEELQEKPKRPRKAKKSPESDKMPLKAWVSLKISQEKKLRKDQAREIEIFLKKQGLGEMENKDKYEEAFSKF